MKQYLTTVFVKSLRDSYPEITDEIADELFKAKDLSSYYYNRSDETAVQQQAEDNYYKQEENKVFSGSWKHKGMRLLRL
jgi:hypothetical protein